MPISQVSKREIRIEFDGPVELALGFRPTRRVMVSHIPQREVGLGRFVIKCYGFRGSCFCTRVRFVGRYIPQECRRDVAVRKTSISRSVARGFLNWALEGL